MSKIPWRGWSGWDHPRTLADDMRDNPKPVDDKPHVHFHSHAGTVHIHEHRHPDDHAHSHLTRLPAHE